jgi:Spy/CpxP family protein refolding chaperone
MNLLSKMSIFGPMGLVFAMATGNATAATAQDVASRALAPSAPFFQGPNPFQGAVPSQGAAAPPTQQSTNPMPEQATTRQAGKHDPLHEIFNEALAKARLDDSQRAKVEQLHHEVMPKEEAVREARHDFLGALAEQLKSGHVDETALRQDLDALVKAREEASPAMRKAFEELHEILTPEQRVAFADAVEARLREFASKKGSWSGMLAKDHGLSKEQESSIERSCENARMKAEEGHAKLFAILEAFKGDQFSIEQIAPIANVGERTRDRAKGIVDMAKEVARDLTPEQLTELGNKIEARLAKKEAPEKGTAPESTPSESAGEHVGQTQQPVGFMYPFGWGGLYGYPLAYPFMSAFTYPFMSGFSYPFAWSGLGIW